MNHPKSQALHTDLQLPIMRESRAVPYHPGQDCPQHPECCRISTHGGDTTKGMTQHLCPVLGLAVPVSSWASHHAPAWWPLWEWWAVWHKNSSVWNIWPSSCWQGRRARPPERRPGRSGNALTPQEWAARLLVVDVSCSWLLLPQVSWFMCFMTWSMKDAIVPWRSPQDAASILLGPGFASLPIVLSPNFTTQYCQFLRRSGWGHSLTDPYFPSPESS